MVRMNHQGRRLTAQASGRYSHFLRQNVRICGPDILSPSGRNRRSKTYYPSKRQRDNRDELRPYIVGLDVTQLGPTSRNAGPPLAVSSGANGHTNQLAAARAT
jgi:hypothetical protein